MRLGFMWARIRESNWKHFFAKNGPGEIKRKECGPWRLLPNNVSMESFTVRGVIKGGFRGDGFFAAWATLDDDIENARELVEQQANEYFESYALPDCRCRLGLHWKCGIHRNWRG